MTEDQRKFELDVEGKKQLMLDVAEGMKTLYWKHLENKIKAWIRSEEKIQKGMLASKLDAEKFTELNVIAERLIVMNHFLRINEIILKENQSFLERVIRPVADKIVHYVRTFVGGNHD